MKIQKQPAGVTAGYIIQNTDYKWQLWTEGHIWQIFKFLFGQTFV